MISDFDYVLVGTGLSSALITLALSAARPGSRLALVERETAPLGNHTWCFHVDDVPTEARRFVEEALELTWPSYVVRFPGYERELAHTYAAVTVSSLWAAVERAFERLSVTTYFGCSAVRIGAREVELEDGRTLRGKLVVDARGPEAFAGLSIAGFQKFVGLELSVRAWPSRTPTVMDATVEQLDGFRFMYALPFSDRRILLEDTYYSASPRLDKEAVEQRVLAYAASKGAEVQSILRREHGVLPLPTRLPCALPSDEEPLGAGYRAGLFHPVTGYSFPLAVQLALAISSVAPEDARGAAIRRLLEATRKQARFLGFLNQLLFFGMSDPQRRNVLERFYRLPEDTIRRFYALTLTSRDRARIVCGRPPRGFSLVQAFSTRKERPL